MIADFPTSFPATATLEPRLRPVTDEDMSRARDFFLILLTRAVAGDSLGIAESVKFPIHVNIDSPIPDMDGPQSVTNSVAFALLYESIFNEKIINALTNVNEDDLVYLPQGFRVGHGEIWFNLYCTDPTCVDSEFLITQINN
jgi:hypothetical protein